MRYWRPMLTRGAAAAKGDRPSLKMSLLQMLATKPNERSAKAPHFQHHRKGHSQQQDHCAFLDLWLQMLKNKAHNVCNDPFVVRSTYSAVAGQPEEVALM